MLGEVSCFSLISIPISSLTAVIIDQQYMYSNAASTAALSYWGILDGIICVRLQFFLYFSWVWYQRQGFLLDEILWCFIFRNLAMLCCPSSCWRLKYVPNSFSCNRTHAATCSWFLVHQLGHHFEVLMFAQFYLLSFKVYLALVDKAYTLVQDFWLSWKGTFYVCL